MTKDRYNELSSDDKLELNAQEIALGWHFCYDWDGLLVGPGMSEQSVCVCAVESKTTDKT